MERYRITPDIGVYFVTFTIVEWLPVLTNEGEENDVELSEVGW